MINKPLSPCRLPAEWEPQSGVLLAWPHADSDWQPILEEISAVFIELTRHIARHESVLIVTPEPEAVKKTPHPGWHRSQRRTDSVNSVQRHLDQRLWPDHYFAG